MGFAENFGDGTGFNRSSRRRRVCTLQQQGVSVFYFSAELQTGAEKRKKTGIRVVPREHDLVPRQGWGFFYANIEPQPNAKYSCAASVAIAR